MTEDDTFKALKRVPYPSILDQYWRSAIMQDDDREKWFTDRGWTRDDFFREAINNDRR